MHDMEHPRRDGGISTYDHAYNYAYCLGFLNWAGLPSDYAAWYVGRYGECVNCHYDDCPHPPHTVAYPEFAESQGA